MDRSVFAEGNAKAAKFALELSWEDLPAVVQDAAKRCLLDLIGAVVGGSRSRGTDILEAFALEQMGQNPEAVVIGRGRKVSATAAALVNGFSANALDIDDGFRHAKGHPGSVVFPAILAAAEKAGANGTKLLEALVIGYEICLRAARAIYTHYDYFHGSGAWGAVGSAAACAHLMGLDAEQTMHALGIAEAYAPMTPTMRSVNYPAMAPKDGIAWGSYEGICAAQLAAKGFTGSPCVLGAPECASALEDLGTTWLITQVYFKPYPCCRWAQPAVDGILMLMREHGFKGGDIARLVIHTFEESAALSREMPCDIESAEYNIMYPPAAAAAFGQYTRGQLEPGCMEDPAIARMWERIEIRCDDSLCARFPKECLSRVEVFLENGASFDSGVMPARGDWDTTPLSPEDIEKKFRDNVAILLDAEGQDQVIGMVREFETMPVADLARVLEGPARN